MRALLVALRHDPARRRRRVAAVAAVAVVLLAGIATMQRVATRGQRMCVAAGQKLGGIWEPPHQSSRPRREAIQRAFAATGVSFAGDTWIRVEGMLDDYTQRWSSMYADACEATYVRGDQSSEALGLRMTCLEGARGGLRALTDVLARANKAVVTQAVNAVQALPPIDRCGDAGRLPSAVPPPADAATRAQVAGTRVDLAEVKALIDTGQWAEARQKAVSVVATARAIGYGPLLAEALEAQGQVEGSMGDLVAGAKLTEEAFWTALSSRTDEVALECAALLSGMTGYTLGQYDEAMRWDRLGQAILNRLGPGHERAAAWMAQGRALIRLRKAEFKEALADLRWALALKQKILRPDDSDLARSWASIGSTLIEMGDIAGALDAYQKQLEVLRSAHGPSSPLLGHALGNRGEALALLGRHAEAEKDLRESLVHWAQMVPPDHPWIAYPLTALGKSLIASGRAREAVPILERAVRIRERGEPNRDMVAESRFALARARWEAGGDRDAARTLAVTARDGYRELPGQAKHAAEIDGWLAAHGRSGSAPLAQH
ncbi:MAG TPA: tetratricopeptide repeat protein [Polyangia bacterium]|nr:tetratricopeptide repeat protein [Polyangia bacterium]